MASETTMHPVNGGNYGAIPQYNAAELPAHNPPPGAGQNGASQPAATAPAPASEASETGPSKDEVGWYFVEQYYTTLSKNPEKLHLFYNKKSQFVSGVEAEKVSVSVGQRAIGERIKEMGVEDCKVRVTNVDSQESQDKSIVIQVIGEMSNKNEPHKKFVQTFILAKQANGYYVLNDIFRYMAEEDDEELEEPEPAEPEEADVPTAETEIKTLTSSDNLAERAKDAEIVDQKLEQSANEQPAALSAAAAVPQVAIPESLTAGSSQQAGSQKTASEFDQVSDAPEIEPEQPKDPEPSPAPASPKQEEAAPTPPKEPAVPPKPSAPKTWASMLAGGTSKIAPPAVPAVPSGSTASAAKKVPAQGNAPTPPAATSTPPAEEQALPSPGGWQTAGQDHGRKGNRAQANAPGAREGSIKAYVKNVTERVDAVALKAALAKYGKIEYFDISRPKSCAFVEFADQASFNAAVAANPHTVSGEEILVEERHVRPQSYGQGGFPPRGGRGGVRGGAGGNMDARGNSPGGSGRGGFKDGRGGYPPRGRGGMANRGRGMPQTA